MKDKNSRWGDDGNMQVKFLAFNFYFFLFFLSVNSRTLTHIFFFLNFILVEWGHFHNWLTKSRLPWESLVHLLLTISKIEKSSVQRLLYFKKKSESGIWYSEIRMNHGRNPDLNSLTEFYIKRNSSEISWDSLSSHTGIEHMCEGTDVFMYTLCLSKSFWMPFCGPIYHLTIWLILPIILFVPYHFCETDIVQSLLSSSFYLFT